MKNPPQKTELYFVYDGTFEGILTCVFDAFELKQIPKKIVFDALSELFVEVHKVETDDKKSNRVLEGLKNKISASALSMLYVCWLSELQGVEMHIFNYICKAFLAEKSIEVNFADVDVLELSKIYHKVKREEERTRQFVRFQKAKDDTYFAAISPIHNVLPLAVDFFTERFADQKWVIYDIKREYALSYDLQKTEIIYFEDLRIDKQTGKLHKDLLAEEEFNFQIGWKEYLHSISIKERKNLKLQRQNMPKRFWKYLTEKQP